MTLFCGSGFALHPGFASNPCCAVETYLRLLLRVHNPSKAQVRYAKTAWIEGFYDGFVSQALRLTQGKIVLWATSPLFWLFLRRFIKAGRTWPGSEVRVNWRVVAGMEKDMEQSKETILAALETIGLPMAVISCPAI